jgi:hypothetical protein
MTQKEFTQVAKYIASTDPKMIIELIRTYQTRSYPKLGAFVFQTDPEMAEQILENIKSA